MDETARADAAPLIPVLLAPPSDIQLSEMLSHPEQWTGLRSHVGGFLHADHSLAGINDATLSGWFAMMNAEGMRLELEVGAVKEWSQHGEKTFEIESVIWERLNRLGGDIASIAMDEPLVATRNALHLPDGYAVEETARFVALVRKSFPRMLVGDIEPYPFLSVEDHANWVHALNARLGDLGVRGLDFYRIDPDWAAFPRLGSWNGIKTISEQCASGGTAFSLIVWGATTPADKQQGRLTAHSWLDGLRTEAAAFKATGGRVDQIVVESWIGLPDEALPDSAPATFAGAAASALEILHPSLRDIRVDRSQ